MGIAAFVYVFITPPCEYGKDTAAGLICAAEACILSLYIPRRQVRKIPFSRGRRPMLEHDAIAFVAEQKIQEALQNGDFDQLPGAGKPLAMEDLSHVPPEVRMAYTILKNSGFVDAPQDMQRPLTPDKELKRSSPEEGTANGKLRKLDVLMHRIRRARGQADFLPPILDSLYLEKLLRRV
jgi:hypothetical protein